MATFKLDDRDIPFEPGDSIIRAAHRVGVDIPHYCWHPGLSVAANCRMCLVEILPPPGRPALMLDVLEWDAAHQQYVPQRKPKLQPACQMAAADGLVVRSQTSEHVAIARSAVQELLLLNHPVDCPICDQAGECRLQDYWLQHQATKKRMRDEPVHKPKAVVFGPTIVYDAERCIVCTRCVRVTEELARDPVLSVRERGNLNEIVVAPGRQLDNNYTLMTEYVCPVGALTSIDFRFKARVWFLRSARTVCTGCATGCNAFSDYDPRNQTVYRYRPRENLAVNTYWMCDVGMLDYQRIHDGRVLTARIGGESTPRDAALARAAELLAAAEPATMAVVLSAEHSQEDNIALLWLARNVLGTTNLFISGRPEGLGDDILLHTDKNPNTAGVAQLLELSPARAFSEFGFAAKAGKLRTVLALGSSIPNLEQSAALGGVGSLIALSSHEGPWAERAHVLLPASTWAESDGTFVNAKGIAQLSEKAITPHGDSRPAWRLVSDLARLLGKPTAWKRVSDVRAALAPETAITAAAAIGTGANG
ncbi:MAG TPA: 2Fe-2S iron-sulfur cluster-binding protein [Polyangiaceae bacterium]|nr:2Fe-2S iron-sulfur cluster-binding protein [Polyangiaceae bacterium]